MEEEGREEEGYDSDVMLQAAAGVKLRASLARHCADRTAASPLLDQLVNRFVGDGVLVDPELLLCCSRRALQVLF